jgi:hypothetical protein
MYRPEDLEIAMVRMGEGAAEPLPDAASQHTSA